MKIGYIKTIYYNILIIILGLASIPTIKDIRYFLICMAFLMVLVTYSSYSDRPMVYIKIILMICFGIVSGSFMGFVVFACLDGVNKVIRNLLPVTLYAVFNVFVAHVSLPAIILRLFILMAFLLVISLIELICDKVFTFMDDADKKFERSAINEMHTKKYNRELLLNRYLSEKNARLMEREEISRNIHNSVGHSITAAVMTLDAADMLYDKDPKEARHKMNTANERIRGSLESIRRAVRVLDSENCAVSASDFKEGIKNVADEFSMDTNVKVHLYLEELADDIMIDHEHSEFLTGAVKELLTNGRKHGGASEYYIHMSGDSRHILVSVRDNGKSEKEINIAQGFGLKKIIEYVKRCGGNATFDIDDGFIVKLELPITERENVND